MDIDARVRGRAVEGDRAWALHGLDGAGGDEIGAPALACTIVAVVRLTVLAAQ